MFDDLGKLLCTITGFDSFSLQPNAGASGEYAGLMVIRAYHKVYHYTTIKLKDIMPGFSYRTSCVTYHVLNC